jgi:hypothetical protein
MLAKKHSDVPKPAERCPCHVRCEFLLMLWNHPTLRWLFLVMVMMWLICALRFFVPSPLLVPLFALALPFRLVGLADALLGAFHIDWLLLLKQGHSLFVGQHF